MNTKQRLSRSVSHYITKKTVVNGEIVNRPSWFRTVLMWQLKFGHVIDLQAYARRHRIPTINEILYPHLTRYNVDGGITAYGLSLKHLEQGLNMGAVYPLNEDAKQMLAAQFKHTTAPRGH